MWVLVLGGTGFVGRAVVDEALRQGCHVTTVNRGVTGRPPPGVQAVRADRTEPGALDKLLSTTLAGRHWTAVVDTWKGEPAAVDTAARLLADRANFYAYVSSRSVYALPVALGADESAPVVEAPPDATDGDYPQRKAGAERAVLAAYGSRALIARAGFILGPHEDIGRLPWWLSRIARGGPVLAPGPADLPLQYVDVRDLAVWLLGSVRARITGVYNVVSRPGHATMRALLEACRAATGSDAELCWTPPETILEAGVGAGHELPLWIPPGHEYRWLHDGDASRAHASGLRCRPVAATVADTWAWMRDLDGPPPLNGTLPAPGLDPEREAELLRLATAT
jgi:nucleoside-diphosphate-sugar epimerase